MIGSRLVNRVQVSPNHEPRFDGARPTFLILHYTGMASGQEAVDWLCNPVSRVSCHYLVDIDGCVVQMVDENLRAWHAGQSHWSGTDDINSASIGIEIQNGGHAAGCPAFPCVQMVRVAALCLDIMERHGLAPQQVLAHSDIAPGRKIDPGEVFDWRFLALRGIGQMVVASTTCSEVSLKAIGCTQTALAELGFGIEKTGNHDNQTRIVVEAFQRRYRPSLVNGSMDGECLDILQRLLAVLPVRAMA